MYDPKAPSHDGATPKDRWIPGLGGLGLLNFPIILFDFFFWWGWQDLAVHLGNDGWSKGFYYGVCMLILELFLSVISIGAFTAIAIPSLVISWFVLVYLIK